MSWSSQQVMRLGSNDHHMFWKCINIQPCRVVDQFMQGYKVSCGAERRFNNATTSCFSNCAILTYDYYDNRDQQREESFEPRKYNCSRHHKIQYDRLRQLIMGKLTSTIGIPIKLLNEAQVCGGKVLSRIISTRLLTIFTGSCCHSRT